MGGHGGGGTDPADYMASCAVLGALVLLNAAGTSVKPFLTLTDRKSWAWEVTAFGFFLKVAQDNKEKVRGMYWAKALVTTGIAAFGGGFLAPLLVGHSPVPLMEEAFAWMLITAWFLTNHANFISDGLTLMMSQSIGSALFKVFFNIFKTQQMVGSIELASKAIAAEELLPHSAYFPQAVAGPLICGFLGGCGGMFLPFDTGLKPIEDGRTWNVRAAFICPVIYFVATRYFQCDLLDAKMGICLLRMTGDLFPEPRDAVLRAVTSVVYKGTNVRSSPNTVVVPVNKV